MHDHEDCFKREHDISAAWARAEDEVKALKLQLDDQAQKYNAILDTQYAEFKRLHQENELLREKIVVWKRYRALLTEELESAVGMAWIHGWRSSPERIARGKELRKELGIEEDSCPDCPPEKDCMKWNGCSCQCHKRTDRDTRTPERKAADEKIAYDSLAASYETMKLKLERHQKALKKIEDLDHDNECASDQGSRDGDCMADHRCYCAARIARKELFET